jgi:hypothetical protein
VVVIGYLIRLELLTSLHITLQSDRFDHADRIFFSVRESWESVSRTDSSDLGRAHGRGALVAVDAATRGRLLLPLIEIQH